MYLRYQHLVIFELHTVWKVKTNVCLQLQSSVICEDGQKYHYS